MLGNRRPLRGGKQLLRARLAHLVPKPLKNRFPNIDVTARPNPTERAEPPPDLKRPSASRKRPGQGFSIQRQQPSNGGQEHRQSRP